MVNEDSTAVILAGLQVSSIVCYMAICHSCFIGQHDIRKTEDNLSSSSHSLMEPPGFAGKVSVLARQTSSFRSGIGKLAGDEPAKKDLMFKFRKTFIAEILAT